MYASGEGVLQDYVNAYMWFLILQLLMVKRKQKNNSITKVLTLEQIAEAQKLSRECIKQEYKNCGR